MGSAQQKVIAAVVRTVIGGQVNALVEHVTELLRFVGAVQARFASVELAVANLRELTIGQPEEALIGEPADAGSVVVTRFGVAWDRVHPKVSKLSVEMQDGRTFLFERES